jgi:hypothetical protein
MWTCKQENDGESSFQILEQRFNWDTSQLISPDINLLQRQMAGPTTGIVLQGPSLFLYLA